MKRKIYFNLVLIFLAVSFVSCDNRCDEIIDDTSLIFSYQNGHGFSGLFENLSVNANATHYSFESNTQKKTQKTVRTNVEQWEFLKNAFDLETFRNIGEGEDMYPDIIVSDTGSSTFSVTIDDETYSFIRKELYNFDNDENYQKMIPFFNAIRNLAWSFH
jgi:hypothetical protein